LTRLGKSLVGVSLLAAAAGGGALAACLDLSPVAYEVDSSVSVPDAAIDVAAEAGSDADAAAQGPCVRCLITASDAEPPGCADEIAACVANAKCALIYACAVADHCFEQPSFREIVNCGLPCIEQAQVNTNTDPAITLIYNIAVCAQASCNGVCHVGDAALGGD
jgi:hypothetical protein